MSFDRRYSNKEKVDKETAEDAEENCWVNTAIIKFAR
jgi:hypothetical protein